MKTSAMLLIEAKDDEQRDIKQIIIDTYRNNNSIKKTAKALGISRITLWKWRKRLRINLDDV